MKKGFTLIELLAVIIILGVITVIAIPSVNKAIKKGKEQLYEVQIKNIELGARSWAAENAFDLPDEDGQVITLTLGQLKVAGFVELDVKNPVTDKLFPNDMEVTITRQMNNFLYDVLEDSGSSTGDEDNIDLYSPTIILSGSASVYIEFGETYVEPGYTARNSSGVDITDQVTSEIKSNNSVVPSVDTTRFGQYKITYTVVDNERSASVIRTVTVEDTTAPELTIPSDITISDSEVATFDVMEGVSATDNSGEEVTITTSGNLSSISGTYTITYTATDIKGNETVKTRTITVTSVTYTDFNVLKGVNVPKLSSGMTPIKWNGTSWVNTTEDDPDWYDYTTKKWANVQTEDGSFWVWIPRYAYSITSGYHTSTTGIIDVKFLIDDTNTTRDGTNIAITPTYSGDSQTNYVKHPAFTFGTDEVTGLWVAKFEPSDDGNSNVQVIPNAISWQMISTSDAFDVSLEMKNNANLYGWQIGEVDSHMMKNTEWGAVAYLSQSTYGINGEVWINPSDNYTTGCAGNSVSSAATVGCLHTYETTNGVKTSTTGNIYGVYDMSGSSRERMAAYLNTTTETATLFNNGASLSVADPKYINLYQVGTTDSSVDNYEANSNIFGDAMYEISSTGTGYTSWYGGASDMVSGSSLFPYRGGDSNQGSNAGILAFDDSSGSAYTYYTFRPVILVNYKGPTITFSPYESFNSTTISVTSDVGVDNSSLKYFISSACGAWDDTIPPESSFTQSFENNTSVSNGGALIRIWALAKDINGNTTMALSGYSSGVCAP